MPLSDSQMNFEIYAHNMAFKDYQQLTHHVEISLEKSSVNYLWK